MDIFVSKGQKAARDIVVKMGFAHFWGKVEKSVAGIISSSFFYSFILNLNKVPCCCNFFFI
jgi:hypothetical protein